MRRRRWREKEKLIDNQQVTEVTVGERERERVCVCVCKYNALSGQLTYGSSTRKTG